MRSRNFRQKARITVPTTARAADGSIENAEKLVGDFYASVQTRNDNEADANGKMVSRAFHQISIRYNSSDLSVIPNNAKITINGLMLYVTSSSVKDLRNRIIEITAEERL